MKMDKMMRRYIEIKLEFENRRLLLNKVKTYT